MHELMLKLGTLLVFSGGVPDSSARCWYGLCDSDDLGTLNHLSNELEWVLIDGQCFNFLLALTWPLLVEAFQPQGAFGWYAAWCLILWILVLLFMPETKGRPIPWWSPEDCTRTNLLYRADPRRTGPSLLSPNLEACFVSTKERSLACEEVRLLPAPSRAT
jgi:hypothetical protein